MELEQYFTFFDNDDIRIKGTRVGIETVVEDYLTNATPEEIAARYRTLTLEQVYATITYYLHNRQDIDAYLARLHAYSDAAYHAQQQQPPPVVRRLKALKQKKKKKELVGI